MSTDLEDVVTVELDCGHWSAPYSREITLRQLGDLLLILDGMAEETAVAEEGAA
ncbi:hypothetical protein FHS38_006000 [Streptomyces netropsis]|uniref:Uncharacterized protein n=1 Tax=Streptomyces netropsis TaxID=55404 RepID=A0A7W7PHF8_STRNE|nr:hypothetical protein [Streptomyces netropsis]MBB4889922.1 hypothetical protein [Streptomyces netropsis]